VHVIFLSRPLAEDAVSAVVVLVHIDQNSANSHAYLPYTTAVHTTIVELAAPRQGIVYMIRKRRRSNAQRLSATSIGGIHSLNTFELEGQGI